MFERFTERARQIVVLAHEEARDRGAPSLGVEHLLLGAVRVGAGGSVDAEALRQAIDRPGTATEGAIPFAASTAATLQRALELTAGEIHPAHVMRALLENQDVAALVERCGGDVAELRAQEPPAPSRGPIEVAIGDELIGDLGNPRTDVRMVGAILRRDGRAAGWLRTSGVDEAWVKEFEG